MTSSKDLHKTDRRNEPGTCAQSVCTLTPGEVTQSVCRNAKQTMPQMTEGKTTVGGQAAAGRVGSCCQAQVVAGGGGACVGSPRSFQKKDLWARFEVGETNVS